MSASWLPPLPLFLNKKNKALTGWIVALSATLFYLSSNHLHVFEPTSLPITAIEQAIPFVPLTVWIYVSEYWAIVLLYAMAKDDTNANRFVYAYTSLQVVSFVIFMLWPTTYPRAEFPLPPEVDAATRSVLTFLRQIDTPANCCPSLHVGSIYLASFLFLGERRRIFPLVFAGATAIALSTLTTKQHYLIDVAGGILMAVVLHWFFHRVVAYRPVATARVAATIGV